MLSLFFGVLATIFFSGCMVLAWENTKLRYGRISQIEWDYLEADYFKLQAENERLQAELEDARYGNG